MLTYEKVRKVFLYDYFQAENRHIRQALICHSILDNSMFVADRPKLVQISASAATFLSATNFQRSHFIFMGNPKTGFVKFFFENLQFLDFFTFQSRRK